MNPRPPLQRRCAGAVIALALISVLGNAGAQRLPSEPGVKAAYLAKFLPYVEWPEAALPPGDSPLVIGVAAADPIEAELQSLIAGRRVNGHPLEARVLKDGDSAEGVHVVFVGRPAGLSAWVERLRGRPVLIVSDVPQSLERGSMLSLIAVDGRIRFEAAPAAAERAGLRLSARLLALADRVVTR